MDATTPAGLADQLITSARLYAHRALSTLAGEDLDLAGLDLAMALEHLAKAYLTRHSPTLLVEVRNGNPRHLAMLAGVITFDQSSLRTIGLRDALSRVTVLDKLFEPIESTCGKVVAVRGGSAHLGSDSGGRAVLAVALRAARWLIDALDDVDEATFFGEYVDAVSTLIEERESTVRERVDWKMGRAREYWKGLYGGMTDEERETHLAHLDLAAQRDPDERIQSTGCPACHRMGTVRGELHLDAEPDWDVSDGESVAYGTLYALALHGRQFRCPGCHLALDGIEELAAAGVLYAVIVRQLDKGDDDAAIIEQLYADYADQYDPEEFR